MQDNASSVKLTGLGLSSEMVEYTAADDGGTEIVLGLPLEFNSDNIEEMAKLY